MLNNKILNKKKGGTEMAGISESSGMLVIVYTYLVMCIYIGQLCI